MSYNPEIFRRVREELEKRRVAEEAAADMRCGELYARSPEIASIDASLKATSMDLFRIACDRNVDLKEKMTEAKERNRKLRERRAALVEGLGLPADYSDVRYACPLCSDSGYVGMKMCDCLRRALASASLEASGIGPLLRSQTFDSFSLDYYADDPSSLEKMQYALREARAYAENFDLKSGNLLFIGGTGLGKTHLSTAIAATVIGRGYTVVYESASQIFADYEHDQFRRPYSDTSAPRAERYESAELLIIDDLGSEFANAFTVSSLYQLLNFRVNHRLPTIVSTNLSPRGLTEKYDDRIASRILGEYRVLLFEGTDVRMKKL